MREQQKVRAAHANFRRFLVLIAFAVLALMLFWHAWVAAGVWTFIVLNIIVLYGALTGTYVPSDGGLWTNDGDHGDGFFYDRFGMMLGPDDSDWAGDGVRASPSFEDDDL